MWYDEATMDKYSVIDQDQFELEYLFQREQYDQFGKKLRLHGNIYYLNIEEESLVYLSRMQE